MFGKLKFRIALTIGAILALAAVLAACGGDAGALKPREATKILLSGGPLALAQANGETPRYGGTFLRLC